MFGHLIALVPSLHSPASQLYSSHTDFFFLSAGIVYKKTGNLKVIHFAKDIEEEGNEEDGAEDVDMVDGKILAKLSNPGQLARKLCARKKAFDDRRNGRNRSMHVQWGDLEEFRHESKDGEGRYLVYEYGVEEDLSGKREATSSRACSADNAAEVAKWFADNGQQFGEYNLEKWNCEHFATFCKTTDRIPALLTKELETKESDEATDAVGMSRDDLKRHSACFSHQTA